MEVGVGGDGRKKFEKHTPVKLFLKLFSETLYPRRVASYYVKPSTYGRTVISITVTAWHTTSPSVEIYHVRILENKRAGGDGRARDGTKQQARLTTSWSYTSL